MTTNYTRPEDVSNEVLADQLQIVTDLVQLSKLINEAARRLRAVAWRPIETLPESYKDFDTGGQFLTIANYTDEAPQIQIQDWLFVSTCENGLYTHWMPLPPPPAGQGGG